MRGRRALVVATLTVALLVPSTAEPRALSIVLRGAHPDSGMRIRYVTEYTVPVRLVR